MAGSENPCREPRGTFTLDTVELLGQRSRLEESVLASAVAARRVLSAGETSIQAVGGQLFGAVFGGPIGAAYRTSVAVAAERGAGVQLRLRLTAPELPVALGGALRRRDADLPLPQGAARAGRRGVRDDDRADPAVTGRT